MQEIQKIIDLIDSAIKPDPDVGITGGNIIADGYDEKVDEYRARIATSNKWLAEYQAKIIEETGISNLKIKFTGASGYFIEVSKMQVSKIPESFIQRQTLVNSARFITPELKEFEVKLNEAQEHLSSREYEIFTEVRESVLEGFDAIKNISEVSANIDMVSNFAFVAYENNYIQPKMIKKGDLIIEGGRHPVVEKMEKNFISNDLHFSKKEYVHIITGPNMGGKSTFLRQNALIILMSHIGSFVPAQSAQIPITDRIFSRVGASDNLFLGQSTFMVEMQEVANILHNSTEKSFVIIDEVGRGTSTYDGMSLAWAILKENHDKIKAPTLFATHYHELIDESKKLKGVKNFSVAVGENEENLVFLRKIIPGGIKKSFGLEVARIAGVGNSVISEAKNMLRELEKTHLGNAQMSFNLTSSPSVLEEKGTATEVKIVEKIVEKESEIEGKIRDVNVNNMTPMEALNMLSELKGSIK
ncbi:MAG: DNA mismatch repair protein MutS [Candidatus Gracilibacteria bacterium]|nr:DNA mismatch repair protein MutS [Candidatus Gracilibacteria bacterium]